MKPSQLTCRTLLLLFISLLSIPARASSTDVAGQTVPWWSSPGETDTTAFSALVLLFLLLFAVFHMYARFDRFAEKHNEGTPLQTTIPTLLMIAFAYEIFPPLSHFSILLPLSLIATALARDLMLWFEPMKEHTLKGELEGIMLEELQHEHLGEHDRDGKRVRTAPKQASGQTVTAKSDDLEPERPDTPPPSPETPSDKSKGGTGND